MLTTHGFFILSFGAWTVLGLLKIATHRHTHAQAQPLSTRAFIYCETESVDFEGENLVILVMIQVCSHSKYFLYRYVSDRENLIISLTSWTQECCSCDSMQFSWKLKEEKNLFTKLCSQNLNQNKQSDYTTLTK